MKAPDKFFYVIYTMTSNHGTLERYNKTIYFLTATLALLLSFFVFLVVQYLRFTPNSFLFWIFMFAIIVVVSYILINNYFIKSGRYKKIIRIYRGMEKDNQAFYTIAIIFFIMVAIFVLFAICMLISYLYAINP